MEKKNRSCFYHILDESGRCILTSFFLHLNVSLWCHLLVVRIILQLISFWYSIVCIYRKTLFLNWFAIQNIYFIQIFLIGWSIICLKWWQGVTHMYDSYVVTSALILLQNSQGFKPCILKPFSGAFIIISNLHRIPNFTFYLSHGRIDYSHSAIRGLSISHISHLLLFLSLLEPGPGTELTIYPFD